jgi:hypothetical protein
VDGIDRVRNWVATDDQCESVDASGGGGGGGGAGGGSGSGSGSGSSGGGGGAGGGSPGAGGPSGGEHGLTALAVASRSGRIRITLSLPGPGKVSVGATARLRGRTVLVGRRVRRAKAPGTLTVTLRTTHAARRAVRHRRLKAAVKITFSPKGGGAELTVTRWVVLRRHAH